MYQPRGRVIRITITLNSAIWTHPLMVIAKPLEPLGVDQGVDEVDHDDDGHDRAEDAVEHIEHGCDEKAGTERDHRDIKHEDTLGESQVAGTTSAALVDPARREHLTYPHVTPLGRAHFSGPSRDGQKS